ncbi:hypothetical protein [Gloeobacter violaceus]|uniref:Gsr2662 protein n=1 Tax=Gloeobacter violaceus (strain ATCC 29082 / PCC 7421) TaxID=251221 RepID=Q7NH75_GLOVI|nr:hypothetical protein [Gloeobacter violaceus]BAC90603.1 gsr2662 [Gloeobacter violaceus PCC 7421]
MKDMAASVRDRLYAEHRRRGEEFQFLVTRYALERVLYRLGRSRHVESFVLKGAMLFAIWADEPHRAT